MPAERRGPVVGRFCKTCGSIYARFAAGHKGKPVYGKDHVAAPCSHEGEPFEPGDDWWEPAVELLPAPAEAEEPTAEDAT